MELGTGFSMDLMVETGTVVQCLGKTAVQCLVRTAVLGLVRDRGIGSLMRLPGEGDPDLLLIVTVVGRGQGRRFRGG